MATACPSCEAPLAAADVVQALGLARCPACGDVFELGPETPEAELAPEAEPEDDRPLPELSLVHPYTPKAVDGDGLTTRVQGDVLVLEYRWLSATTIGQTFMAMFWNGIMAVILGPVVLGAVTGGSPESLVFLLFGSLHIAIGVGLAYQALAGWLNRTTITVAPHGFDIAHGPLPWRGGGTYPTHDLHQLYVVSRQVRTKNSHRTVYDLHAATSTGDVILLRNHTDPERLRAVEYQIEHHLGIVNRAVKGELA